MDIAVDWSVLGDAMKFYQNKKGYDAVELPWTARSDIIARTCPESRWVIKSDIGDLIGSAEQAFIQQDNDGEILTGRFVACTPCFRNEDEVNWLRQKTFMKVELYDNENATLTGLFQMLSDAIGFFSLKIPTNFLEVVKTEEGYDILCMQIELGSYGIREIPELGLRWLYGTGVAEPRYSTMLKQVRSIGA